MKSEDFDVLKFLQERNIPYSYSGNNVSSGWIGINCVFCIDQSNHLGINLRTKAFSCFKCAEKGSATKLIQEIDGVDYHQSLNVMKEYTDGAFVAREKHYQSKVLFPTGTSKNMSDNHIAFLEFRRHDHKLVIPKYNLFATGPIGDYKHRLIIPVYHKNRIVSFVGRDVSGNSPVKYKNSSESYSIKDVKQCLYNFDTVIRDKAVIVEGVFDA